MPIDYDVELKNARLEETRKRIDGGTLEICTKDYRNVLATFTLPGPCGEVSDGQLVLSSMPKRATAMRSADAVVARFRDSDGRACASGLTVGDETSDADVIVYPQAALKSGQTVELVSVRIVHG